MTRKQLSVAAAANTAQLPLNGLHLGGIGVLALALCSSSRPAYNGSTDCSTPIDASESGKFSTG